MTSSTQDNITFKKTLQVTMETTIEYTLTYDDFCERFMERLVGEDDEAFSVRREKVWFNLLAKRHKPKGNAAFIDLGQEDQEADWDDEVWDGGGEAGPDDECNDDIMGLVESVQKDDEAFQKNKEIKRQKRADALAEQLKTQAAWKAQRLRDEEERKERVRREEEERLARVKKAKEERLAALRKEMDQIEADLGK